MEKFIMTSHDDDIIGSTPTRAAPARGRRSGQKKYETADKEVLSATSNISRDSAVSSDSPSLDHPKGRRQMWGVTNHAEFAKDNRLVNNDSDSEENVIPEIPVLDEINEEEVIQSVAVPPAVFQELLSFRELDSDLMRQSAFSMLDNEIDLKILTKSLVREKDLMEPDEPWEMNQLFAEIQSIATLSKDPETRPEENKEMLI